MENASEALIMAGAVLILIIALTISMSSFTAMRTQIDEITQAETKLDLVKDGANYINYETATENDARVVGIETVISSIYRVPKENYIIYIKSDNYGSAKTTTLGDEGAQDQFIGSTKLIDKDEEILKIEINKYGSNSVIDKLLGDKSFYNENKDNKFYEYLGEYQENKPNVDAANRETYRVITYVQKY